MAELLTLLIIITVSLLFVKAGAIALQKTGLSAESAGFQAQSAFMGVGFTTSEAENVVNHPVRRRIIRLLMLLGFGAVTSTIGTVMLTFTQRTDTGWSSGTKLGILAAGLALLWVGYRIRPLDRLLDRVIRIALEKTTDLQILDFEELLKLNKGYTVANINVEPGGWMENRTLRELQLTEEGILILSIHRGRGVTLGTPTSRATVDPGDRVLCYGLEEDLARLGRRERGEAGQLDHELAKKRHRLRLVEERAEDRIAETGRERPGDPG